MNQFWDAGAMEAWVELFATDGLITDCEGSFNFEAVRKAYGEPSHSLRRISYPPAPSPDSAAVPG